MSCDWIIIRRHNKWENEATEQEPWHYPKKKRVYDFASVIQFNAWLSFFLRFSTEVGTWIKGRDKKQNSTTTGFWLLCQSRRACFTVRMKYLSFSFQRRRRNRLFPSKPQNILQSLPLVCVVSIQFVLLLSFSTRLTLSWNKRNERETCCQNGRQ